MWCHLWTIACTMYSIPVGQFRKECLLSKDDEPSLVAGMICPIIFCIFRRGKIYCGMAIGGTGVTCDVW